MDVATTAARVARRNQAAPISPTMPPAGNLFLGDSDQESNRILDKECEYLRGKDGHSTLAGDILFPGDHTVEPIDYTITPESFSKFWERHGIAADNPLAPIHFVMCVDYTFDTSGSHH